VSRTVALFARVDIAFWFAAGACWIGQLVVPWTSAGPLSHASTVDAVRLVLRGPLDQAVPFWMVFAVLVLPMAGLLLVAIAGSDRPLARRLRLLTAVAGTVTFSAILWTLTRFDPTRLGPGGLVASVGTAIVVMLIVAPRPRRSREP
jgi:hypothetical protein